MTSPWDEPDDFVPPPHLSQELHGGYVDPKVHSSRELEEAEERHAREREAAATHVPWYRRIFRRS